MTIGKRTLKVGLAGLVLVIGQLLAVVGPGGAAPAPTKGKQLLNELIARVNQEGELNISSFSTFGTVAGQMERAFLNRFGLKIKNAA